VVPVRGPDLSNTRLGWDMETSLWRLFTPEDCGVSLGYLGDTPRVPPLGIHQPIAKLQREPPTDPGAIDGTYPPPLWVLRSRRG